MDDFFSITASIISIIAAFISWARANNAKKYSEVAISVRDEMRERRGMIELSKIHSETNKILQIASEIGPTSTSKSLRGKNPTLIAKQVEEYSRFLNEHNRHFDEPFSNLARTLCDELGIDIENLANANNSDEIKTAGKSIYSKINDFLPHTKNYADGERERKVKI